MESKFMISEVFRTSWKCTKSQIWVLAGLFIGYIIISMIMSLFAMPAQNSIAGQIIVNLITVIFSCLFMLGYFKNIFQALDDEEPQFSAYGQQSRKILTYLIASLLYGIVVGLGTVLLIVPGIYLGLRLQFFMAFIVEEDTGIIESLKRSWEITEGQVMQLFLLTLCMIGVYLLGFILLIVGIFVAIPLVYTMHCDSFRKLNTAFTSPTEDK